jgi:hypothetical protein
MRKEYDTTDISPRHADLPDVQGFKARKMLYARDERMRYQVGRIEKRAERFPTYERNGKLAGYTVTATQAEVFRLCGWGETIEKALLRAQRNK